MGLEIGVWNAAITAAKLLLYGVTFAAAGGAFFLWLFALRLSEDELTDLRRYASLAAIVGLALTAVRLLLIVVNLGGGVGGLAEPVVWQFVLEGGEGQSALLRGIGLLLIAGGARRAASLAAAGGLLSAASFALSGHTGALDQVLTAKLLLALHLIAAAYWLGSLYPLYRMTGARETQRLGLVAKRFGDIAAVMVPLLLSAGAVLLWLVLGDPLLLLESIYGRLLALKLVLVAALLALASANKLRLAPRLFSGVAAAAGGLRQSIVWEIRIAVAVLAVTAAFTTITGPPAAN